jgi:hypothetical protein
MFSFTLEESAAQAKAILEAYGCYTEGWDKFVAHYLKVKGPLIEAIDPVTGRIEFPGKVDIVAGERESLYCQGLSVMRGRYSIASCVGKALAALERHFPYAFARTDLIPHKYEARLATVGPAHVIKKGLKFSKAVAAYLRACGLEEDLAASVTADIMRESGIAPVAGTLVLSVNILDLLLTGEHLTCAATCHNLAGGYRSGNLQYLSDKQTCVAYFYAKSTGHKKVPIELPLKQWRQLVCYDPEHKSVSFLRHYPQPGVISERQHRIVRERAAKVMGKLLGTESTTWVLTRFKTADDCEGKGTTVATQGSDAWTVTRKEEGWSNAYMDWISTMVYLEDGGREKLHLRLPHPTCPGCGKANRMRADGLNCEACAKSTVRCVLCRISVRGEQNITYIGTSGVCLHCAAASTFICPRCSIRTMNQNARSRDGQTVCLACSLVDRYECPSCGDIRETDDGYEEVRGVMWCLSCFSERYISCYNCGLAVRRGAECGYDGDSYCGRCYDSQQAADEEEEEEEEDYEGPECEDDDDDEDEVTEADRGLAAILNAPDAGILVDTPADPAAYLPQIPVPTDETEATSTTWRTAQYTAIRDAVGTQAWTVNLTPRALPGWFTTNPYGHEWLAAPADPAPTPPAPPEEPPPTAPF